MARHNNKYLDKGFIKMPRHLDTMPDMARMLEHEGALGLGVHDWINLKLNNSAEHWLDYTSRQFRAWAIVFKTKGGVIKRIIDDYDLFIIKGNRFTSRWMIQQYRMDDSTAAQDDKIPARTYHTHAEDIDKDVKKENKEKGIVRVSDDTHQPSSSCPPPAPSDEEDSNTNYKDYNHYFKR